MDADQQATAHLPLVDALDEAGERRDNGAAEDRRLDSAHAQDARREAEEQSRTADCDREARELASRQARRSHRANPAREGCPEGRLPLGREEQEDAESERHGDPGKQAALLHLLADAS